MNEFPGWERHDSHGLYWTRGNFAVVSGTTDYEWFGRHKTETFLLLVNDGTGNGDGWSLDSGYDIPQHAVDRAKEIEEDVCGECDSNPHLSTCKYIQQGWPSK